MLAKYTFVEFFIDFESIFPLKYLLLYAIKNMEIF